MQFQKNIFIYLCLLFCNVIFYFSSAKAILGNPVRQAHVDEFPFVVGIIKRSENFDLRRDVICTGALIALQDILTNDHCLGNQVSNGFFIVIGSIDIRSGSKHFPAWWTSYYQWAHARQINSEFPRNDISIIRIPILPEIRINHAELSYPREPELKREHLIIVGWGEMNKGSFPNMLQTAKVKSVSGLECGIHTRNEQNMVFTIGHNKFTVLMEGDIGGPVLWHGRIVAINSGSCPVQVQHLNQNKINLHLLIRFYQNFIEDTLPQL